jgi:GNAT superfamily N-acetyltransferase
MTTRSIRSFQRGDLAQVVALSLRAWAPVFESLKLAMDSRVYATFFPDWRTVQASAVESTLTDPSVSAWVMVADDLVLGFVAAKLHLQERMGEIHMVAVDPSAHRSGIAHALCETAERWMHDAGMAIVMVETGGDAGHAPARAAYESMGYRPFPVARYFKDLDGSAG